MIQQLANRLTQAKPPLHIHLIGVAGSGMSGLAQLLLQMGHQVSGCDRSTTAETDRLQAEGLKFFSPHIAESVEPSKFVVYSSAIPPDNPALARARELNIPCVRRADCLAAILAAKQAILVAGTHGKTTTSALTAHLLGEASEKPSHYVGAEIPILGRNARWNQNSPFMIAEGDESDGTLVNYRPTHSIILNIEAEHLDHYPDLAAIEKVFQTLIDQTSGKIFYCAECPTASKLLANHPHAIAYGWSERATLRASNISERQGRIHFDVYQGHQHLGRAELGIPGRHNVLNALAAIGIALELRLPFESIARGLASFAGAKRRFETKYLSHDFRVIDDYGHHPTEIEATLQTARSLKPKRLIVLFQPHRYTRTQRLADDFGRALQLADHVYVTDIYPASEPPIPGISGATIVNAIKLNGQTRATSLPDLNLAHITVGNTLRPGDLLLTIGAGNVHEAGSKIARDLTTLESVTCQCQSLAIARLYEPLRLHTTIKTGGPAQFWLQPTTFDDFQTLVKFCRQRSIPVRIIGRGSNLLVRDGGIPGFVIHPSDGEFAHIQIHQDTLTAGVGVRFKKIAAAARQAKLGGFEWMEGIPGNLGGGLRMNAGAMGIETFDQVVSITFLDEDGEIRTRSQQEVQHSYRNAPELQHNFALQATLRGTPSSTTAIDAALDASKHKRKSSQPIAASCGCIFKNPKTLPAGKIIDQLGLKGTRIGGAEISNIHGNFFINANHAKTNDILELIELVKTKARKELNLELETEVQITGENHVRF